MRRGPRRALRILPGSTGHVSPADPSGLTRPALVDDGSRTARWPRVVRALPRAVRLPGTRDMEPTSATDVAEASSPAWATADSKVRRNTVRGADTHHGLVLARRATSRPPPLGHGHRLRAGRRPANPARPCPAARVPNDTAGSPAVRHTLARRKAPGHALLPSLRRQRDRREAMP